jgi:hypothetical protein
MALKEISLAEVLDKTSGTSYFTAFVQLVGKTTDLVLYEGITSKYKPLVEELEEKLNTEISEEYLEFLQITNGGKIAGMNLFSLDVEENVNSLYYRNFKTDMRKKLKLTSNVLIIGEYAGGVICFEIDSEGTSSFTLMDIYNREKLEFAFFEDLITFRFYLRLLEGGKKKIEEKKKLKLAAQKLHEQIVKENKERKKISEKARAGNANRASKAGLKKKR